MISGNSQETIGSVSMPMILVVDDEDIVLRATRRILEVAGYPVVTATCGRDGVDTFRAHADEIGAVLLDVNMPKMKGEDVLREIRQIRPAMPAVFTSGYDEEELAEELLTDGKTGFIQKPFRPAELMDYMHTALQWVV
jgi:two-component system, cell cycle sensor histidine kinase and response regulator CckA